MIDEKKLIEETQKYFVNNSIHKNDLAEVIANLPKIGEWISVSERLPIKKLEKERSERGENAIYPVMVTAKVFSYEENKKIIKVKKAFYM